MSMTTLTDEQLIAAYRGGDELAFDMLYGRYESRNKKAAALNHRKNPFLTLEDWTSYVNEHFLIVVKKYRLGSGIPFSAFLPAKMYWLALDVIREERYKRTKDGWVRKDEGVVETYSLEYEYHKDEEGVTTMHDYVENEQARIDVQQDELNTPLFEYLRGTAIECAKFAALRLKGYTFEEIAVECGRQGNANTLKAWGNRMQKRTQELAATFYRSNGLELPDAIVS